MPDQSKLITVPSGKLGIVALKSSEKLGQTVDNYLVKWRHEREHLNTEHLIFNGYTRDSYLIESCCPRFASGEAKGTLSDSIRGTDLYILADVTNTGIDEAGNDHGRVAITQSFSECFIKSFMISLFFSSLFFPPRGVNRNPSRHGA